MIVGDVERGGDVFNPGAQCCHPARATILMSSGSPLCKGLHMISLIQYHPFNDVSVPSGYRTIVSILLRPHCAQRPQRSDPKRLSTDCIFDAFP